jgi:hypothetical protein
VKEIGKKQIRYEKIWTITQNFLLIPTDFTDRFVSAKWAGV